METINPTHYPASRAARVAENYINYKLGGPHRVLQMKQVTEATKESIAGVGNTYILTFSITDHVNDQPDITTTAEVQYYLSAQHKAPNVIFKLQRELEDHTGAQDNAFYNRMKNLAPPLEAQDIPDKQGNVTPEMTPVLNLALAASGYVKWQNSTEETDYRMAVIKSVKQLKRKDTALEFQYNMLIHEMVTQEMVPWQINVLWDPQHGLKVEKQVRLPKSHQ
ncbi:latexin-like [Pelodytes ibericus]